jgi:integrase
MSVFRRGEVYHYRFMHNGRVVRRSTKQRNYKAAEQMESAHLTALSKGDAGLGQKPKAPTLGRFLVDRVKPWAAKKKETTATRYRSGIAPLVAHKPLANLAIDAITSELIDDYAAHRQTEEWKCGKKIRQGRAVGTVNRELRVLRRCLRLAVEWRLLKDVPDINMAGPEKRRERVVGDREFTQYLGCASPLLADVALVLNETGLRPDECHRLEWPDISFSKDGRGSLLVRSGKTPAARRRLPLTQNVRAVLENRWQSAGQPETGFVFPAPTQSVHIEHYTLKKQHRSALKNPAVRKFLLYSLRHSFATRIAPRVDAWTLCKIMGWASLSVAMTYIHTSDDRVLEFFSGHKIGHMDRKQTSGERTGQSEQREVIEESLGSEEYMVSADGLEPSTHALKGHCSTT